MKIEKQDHCKPILFNTTMVQAILDGQKTVTRRVLAAKEILDERWGLDREPYRRGNEWFYDEQTEVDSSWTRKLKSKYQIGDVLWVRETFSSEVIYRKNGNIEFTRVYKADGVNTFNDGVNGIYDIKWTPSIHMPKEAARIFLKVTDVRVERLQDINSDGAHNEGVDGRCLGASNGCAGTLSTWEHDFNVEAFQTLWDSTIKKKDLEEFGWDANPWVWVIEFERCKNVI